MAALLRLPPKFIILTICIHMSLFVAHGARLPWHAAGVSGSVHIHDNEAPNTPDWKRGRLYAINVDTKSKSRFQLVHLDTSGSLSQLQHEALSSGQALSAYLRASYPSVNVGWTWYADTYAQDGWDRLEIRIDDDAPFPDVVKARAAGFVEGNLMGPKIRRYWSNYCANTYLGRGGAPAPELFAFLERQYDWMAGRVEAATGIHLDRPRAGQPDFTAHYAAVDSRLQNAEASLLSSAAAAATLAAAGDDVDGDSGDGVQGGSSQRRYWTLVALVLAQFDGLVSGFWASLPPDAASRNMTWHELYTHNSMGDLYELNVLFPPSVVPSPSVAGAGEVEVSGEQQGAGVGAIVGQPERWYTPGHGEVGEYGYGELLDCSAIIKVQFKDRKLQGGEGGGGVAGGEQGAAGAAGGKLRVDSWWATHNTWRNYYEMVRTWKVYDLPWSETGPLAVSSSPGLLTSKDDWYTTDSFVVMETTNGIYNKTLYDKIHGKAVLMWQRVQVANFGARSGKEWVDLFALHNSGTYNNQWMVLDVQRLERGRASDVLWVLEQIPGETVSEDATSVLYEQGYWASYNVPYFPKIYEATGYPQPSIYATCPRATIFRREQPKLRSTRDVMSLMRLNRYQTDPDSLGQPNNAIAARYDLEALPGHNWTTRAYGSVDAKVVDRESFRKRRTFVVCGPTDTDQPAFRWSGSRFDNVSHDGCVDVFKFGWQSYQPALLPRSRSVADTNVADADSGNAFDSQGTGGAQSANGDARADVGVAGGSGGGSGWWEAAQHRGWGPAWLGRVRQWVWW